MKVLELEHVYLQRGNFILRDISFALEDGGTAALIGRGGAGKTTLIHLIGNALSADAGRISYFGKEMYEDERAIRRKLSVVYDTPNFNTEFTAARMAKEIKKFEPWFVTESFESWMDTMEIDRNKRVKHFSMGTQKKYMLLLALSRLPAILVMDEPANGVDGQSREQMRSMIEEYRSRHPLAILFSAHDPADIGHLGVQEIRLEGGVMV